jgi:hypothetical protein
VAHQAQQSETTASETTEQPNRESESNGGHKTAVRAAAIAAATGATAFAARKAFSGREQSGHSDSGDQKTKSRRLRGGADDSMVGAMIASGWAAAKDSLLPAAEDAAEAAGEWVARSGPEVVNETLVPRFIRGFQKVRRSSGGDDE